MTDFRWVHAMGGRGAAARYLCSLGFGTDDFEAMKRRLSYWTNAYEGRGQMGGNALRALIDDRGAMPGDFDVLTPEEYAASDAKRKRAA